MPLHRLDEEPKESTTLADITCDSDGKFDHFISAGTAASDLQYTEATSLQVSQILSISNQCVVIRAAD